MQLFELVRRTHYREIPAAYRREFLSKNLSENRAHIKYIMLTLTIFSLVRVALQDGDGFSSGIYPPLGGGAFVTASCLMAAVFMLAFFLCGYMDRGRNRPMAEYLFQLTCYFIVVGYCVINLAFFSGSIIEYELAVIIFFYLVCLENRAALTLIALSQIGLLAAVSPLLRSFGQWIALICVCYIIGFFSFYVSRLAYAMRLDAYRTELKSMSLELTNKELSLSNKQFENLAMIDPLTGIGNRRAFELAFAREWRRCMRGCSPLSLLMIDIDFFKQYNDTFGHPEGDRCLSTIARCLEDAVKRPGDTVARIGGEEFAVLLPDTDLPAALEIAKRINSAVGEMNILLPEGLPGTSAKRLTVSVGAAAIVPERGLDRSELLNAADDALYRAKKAGRNQVAHYCAAD